MRVAHHDMDAVSVVAALIGHVSPVGATLDFAPATAEPVRQPWNSVPDRHLHH